MWDYLEDLWMNIKHVFETPEYIYWYGSLKNSEFAGDCYIEDKDGWMRTPEDLAEFVLRVNSKDRKLSMDPKDVPKNATYTAKDYITIGLYKYQGRGELRKFMGHTHIIAPGTYTIPEIRAAVTPWPHDKLDLLLNEEP